jgi:hypothetical protein
VNNKLIVATHMMLWPLASLAGVALAPRVREWPCSPTLAQDWPARFTLAGNGSAPCYRTRKAFIAQPKTALTWP